MNLKLTILLLSILFLSCSPRQDQTVKINPEAIRLNDKAVDEIIALNPKRAIEYLDSALNIEPYYTTGFANKIAAYNQMKDYTKALETTLEYSKTPDFPAKNNAMIAMAYERIGEFDKALPYYKKALKHFEGNDWQQEPLISQIDLAIFTTFIEGKEAGLEKYNQIVSATPPAPENAEFITRIKNEINHYQGGGYLEILDNTSVTLFCIPKEERESFEQMIKKAGLNFEGRTSNGLNNQYKIKSKFASKAIEIGLKECDNAMKE